MQQRMTLLSLNPNSATDFEVPVSLFTVTCFILYKKKIGITFAVDCCSDLNSLRLFTEQHVSENLSARRVINAGVKST